MLFLSPALVFCAIYPRHTKLQTGRVAEWLMAPVLKTGVPGRVSGVRIPPLPPHKAESTCRSRYSPGQARATLVWKATFRLQYRVASLRFPSGVSDEVYELSTSTAEAIRLVSGMVQPLRQPRKADSHLSFRLWCDSLKKPTPVSSRRF